MLKALKCANMQPNFKYSFVLWSLIANTTVHHSFFKYTTMHNILLKYAYIL